MSLEVTCNRCGETFTPSPDDAAAAERARRAA